jgi:hypothetical protein
MPLKPLEEVMLIILMYVFLDVLCCKLIAIGWFYTNDYCSLSLEAIGAWTQNIGIVFPIYTA